MINLSELKTKTNNSEALACRVDETTQLWIKKFCKSNNISVASLLSALVRNFKIEQDKKTVNKVT